MLKKIDYRYSFYIKGGNTGYEIQSAGADSKGAFFFCSEIFRFKNYTVWFPCSGH